jgi:hypothetical protein
MSRRKPKMIRIGSGVVPLASEAYEADFQARLKAAGLDRDDPALDIDAVRLRIARKIAMWLNEWPGCPEKICQRVRGCMAPRGDCRNVKEEPFDPAAWHRDKVVIMRALKRRIAEARASGELIEE